MKIVIITATYNEKDNIGKFISIVMDEVIPKINNHEIYLLVADDNSPDGTSEVVKEYQKKYKNLALNTGEKKGLGAAYVRAMSYAIEQMGADVVISIDGDLQHDPHKIPEFIEKIEQGYDVVSGTRYSEGGSMPKNWPLYRKTFSVVGNTLVRAITGRFYLHDWTGGFRAIKKDVFLKEREKVKPFQGYTFQVAFLYKSILDGYKAGEVPIHFKDRKVGRSKIAPLEYIINLLRYVISERSHELERFFKFLIVGGSGFIVQLIFQETFVHLGTQDAIASGIGAEASIISNFLFNHFWTFSDTKKIQNSSNTFVKLIKFNITSLGAIIIQFAAVAISEKYLGRYLHIFSFSIPTRIAILFPTIIFLVIPLNYIIYNKIIWKTHHLQNGKTAQK